MAENGSIHTASRSGFRIMSDSLIAFQPSIDEPSNIRPSVSSSSPITAGDHGKVLPLALGIGEAQIDPLDLVVLHHLQNVAGRIRHC